MIVQADLGEMKARLDGDAGHAKAGEIVELARQVDILVFELGASIAAHRKFKAETGGPASHVVGGDRQDGSRERSLVRDVSVAAQKIVRFV